MAKLNPTDKIWSGYYCPSCLDACTGYRRFAGKLMCYKCEGEMSIAADPKEWAIILDKEALRAIGDRILVKEDDFRSGLECKACKGKGHTNVQCRYCKGTGFHKGREENGACGDCQISWQGGRKSFGYEICDVCKGRQATVIVPDTSKRPSLTGVVISIGRGVTEFSVGDRVMYSNYTGTDFVVRDVKLRIMKQHDVFCEHRQLIDEDETPDSGTIRKELQDHGVQTLD